MKLADQIIAALSSEKSSLTEALLQTKVLLHKIGHKELVEWVNHELNGYPESAELPSYRILHGQVLANMASIAWQVNSHPITYGQLYRILEKFGYRMGNKTHNKVEVLRLKRRLLGGVKFECVAKIGCPGNGREVSLNEIKTIRERLDLRESDGVDSTSFYDTQAVIDSFVHQHRMVLRSLAKV